MNINTIKGFRDFTGSDATKRAKIKKIIQEQFELYGFEPAETPIIEFEEFVKGENASDEAVRDIFRLSDRGKRELALRYEFTFQLKRIAKNQKLPYKRFQIGPVFRDEPIKKGRLRQFVQCDVDTIGSTAKDEAEILAVVGGIFKKIGIPAKIYVNNRKLINEIMEDNNIPEKDREAVIREVDKLDKLTKKEVADNLKRIGAEKMLEIFTGAEKSFEKYSYYKEIKELKKLCKAYGVKVEFRPFLARGLSYYNGTVFEVWSKDLNVSLAGGGSYLTGDVQSCGIAFGFEPIFLISNVEGDNVKYQIISIDQDAEAIVLAEKMRATGASVNLLLAKSPGKAMDYANSRGIEKVIFVGKDEVKSGKFKVKDMASGKETVVGEGELVK